ncbi:MAG: hypothetical protein EOO72_02380 [Myxococcaceae bacterium]|nr:MAG: hypothetical protein EOO72_02380 [Myxococcaceae bacterium]
MTTNITPYTCTICPDAQPQLDVLAETARERVMAAVHGRAQRLGQNHKDASDMDLWKNGVITTQDVREDRLKIFFNESNRNRHLELLSVEPFPAEYM